MRVKSSSGTTWRFKRAVICVWLGTIGAHFFAKVTKLSLATLLCQTNLRRS